MADEAVFWGIHAGKTGDAETLFFKKNVVGLGWPEMGDLSTLKKDREAFKEKLQVAYPSTKEGAIPVNAGQLFRFLYEMKTGDYIIYPSKRQKRIFIGEIMGDYKFDRSPKVHYKNQRPVKWLKDFPRTTFSQGALNVIGSAMSFFAVENHADEFDAALKGMPKPPIEIELDDEVAYANNAENMAMATEDFILKTLSREMKGHPLEHFVAHLLNKMGYNTRVAPEGADGGVDIIAHRDELGFEPPIINVQVKSSDSAVGDPVVSALYGNVDQGEFGMIVSLGGFTRPAINKANGKSNLRLIDGQELVRLILAHYEEFDSKYKGILPLKRIYVPEVLREEEE